MYTLGTLGTGSTIVLIGNIQFSGAGCSFNQLIREKRDFGDTPNPGRETPAPLLPNVEEILGDTLNPRAGDSHLHPSDPDPWSRTIQSPAGYYKAPGIPW